MYRLWDIDREADLLCMFTAEFVSETAQQPWDRIKVKCSQPLRKDKQFGIVFLHVHSHTVGDVSGGDSPGHHQGCFIQ